MFNEFAENSLGSLIYSIDERDWNNIYWVEMDHLIL